MNTTEYCKLHSCNRFLWLRFWNFGICKPCQISWLAEELSAFLDGMCFVGLLGELLSDCHCVQTCVLRQSHCTWRCILSPLWTAVQNSQRKTIFQRKPWFHLSGVSCSCTGPDAAVVCDLQARSAIWGQIIWNVTIFVEWTVNGGWCSKDCGLCSV